MDARKNSSYMCYNAAEMYQQAYRLVHYQGEMVDSRDGMTKCLPQPVLFTMIHPERYLIFNETRKYNVPFTTYLPIWMLTGRDDLESLERFIPGYRRYSDDGKKLFGAYGPRWRGQSAQLYHLINNIRENPESRRHVLSTWRADDLINIHLKDVPCNTQIFFRKRPGEAVLDMTVISRSSDLLWGLCFEDSATFAALQYYVAAMTGMKVGWCNHLLNNLHIYTEGEKGELANAVYASMNLGQERNVWEAFKDTWPLVYEDHIRTAVDQPNKSEVFHTIVNRQPLRWFQNSPLCEAYRAWYARQPKQLP